MPISAMAPSGSPASSPHSVTGTLPSAVRTICRSARRNGRDSGSKRPASRVLLRSAAIMNCKQVVGADRDEIDGADQRVELEQQRGHLDHGAEHQPLRLDMAVAAHLGEFPVDHRPRLLDLVEVGHHRQHDAQLAPGGGAQQRAQLRPQAAPAGRGRCGSPASPSPGSPRCSPSCRAAPCRRRCRACGRSPAGRRPTVITSP